MSIRAELARRLIELADSPALLADLEADLELALARQELRRLMAAPRVLLAIQHAGGSDVYEVELAGVEWIEDTPPLPEPSRSPRVWEEELPNHLVRPLGAVHGVGAMLHNTVPPPRPHLVPARLIGDD